MNISSVSNPRVKAAARLRERRGRDDQDRIIIDGVREISLAIAAGIEVSELYYFPQLCQDPEHRAILDRLGLSTAGKGTAGQGRQQGAAELIEVTPPVMEKLAYGNRVEGLVAVAPTPRPYAGRSAVAGRALDRGRRRGRKAGQSRRDSADGGCGGSIGRDRRGRHHRPL